VKGEIKIGKERSALEQGFYQRRGGDLTRHQETRFLSAGKAPRHPDGERKKMSDKEEKRNLL